MSKKTKWLDRTLVVSSHHIAVCTTEAGFRKALKHLNIPKKDRPEFVANWHSDATAHYFENQGRRSKAVVVCLRNFEDKSLEQQIGLIAHEAVHIWQQTRNDYGETNPSPEFEAYSIQSLAQTLMSEFLRQTKIPKKEQ